MHHRSHDQGGSAFGGSASGGGLHPGKVCIRGGGLRGVCVQGWSASRGVG